MKNVSIIAAVALLLVGLGACKQRQSVELRYKLTINVETSAGVKSGSSIISARARQGYDNILQGGWLGIGCDVSGSAVQIALGKKEYYFLLVSDPHQYPESEQCDIIKETFGIPNWSETPEWLGAWESLAASRRTAKLERDHFPVVVSFSDRTQRLSAKQFVVDDIGNVEGEGFRISSVTFAIVNEPLSDAITIYLPWLQQVDTDYFASNRVPGDGIFRPQSYYLKAI